MARVVFAALAVGLVAAVASPTWTVYLKRLGPVEYGMSVAEAERAAGVRLVQSEDERNGCTFVRAEGAPDELAFMVVGGTVVRGDVHGRGIATASGVGVGATADEVRRTYGDRIEASPHPYGAAGDQYLTYVPRDARDAGYRVIFETWQDTVRSFRSGRLPEVGWIEGCS